MNISLEISGDIGRVKILPITLRIIQFRIRSFMNDLPDVFIRFQFFLTFADILLCRNKMIVKRNLIYFPKRQSAQFTDGNSACQRFAYSFHQFKFCRPSQDKLSPLLRIVHNLLDFLENGSLLLHFIDNQRTGVIKKEKLRFFPCLKSGKLIVKSSSVIFRKFMLNQRRFSNLSGAGY